MVNLRARLVDPLGGSKRGLPTKGQAMCQLKMRLPCCQGYGYQWRGQGAFVRAELCECVKGCGSCSGQARFTYEGVASSCVVPNPLRVINMINAAKIPSRYGGASLEGFSNLSGNGLQVKELLQKWLQGYLAEPENGLVLDGPVGVGKTYLLAALARAAAMAGRSVKFVDFFQLLSELKGIYSQSGSDSSILTPLINVDLLVIDEMGKGRNTDWELSILDQLVMGRYNQNKIILASTNYSTLPAKRGAKMPLVERPLDQPEVGFREHQFEQSLEERVGERIYSRLLETCELVHITGQDYRRRGLGTRQRPR